MAHAGIFLDIGNWILDRFVYFSEDNVATILYYSVVIAQISHISKTGQQMSHIGNRQMSHIDNRSTDESDW